MDRLIDLCNTFLDNSFRTDCFILEERNPNNAIISSINRNHTSLLKVRVGNDDSIVYPMDRYILPVKRVGSIEDDDYSFEVDSSEWRKYNPRDPGESYFMKNCSMFDKEIFQDDYAAYPFDIFEKELNNISKIFGTNLTIDYRLGEFNTVISTELVQELLIGEGTEFIQFKLLHTDDKLYLKYNASFNDLPVTVYGVVAPRIKVEGRSFLRVI